MRKIGLVLGTLLAACSGGGDGGTEPPPTPTIGVAIGGPVTITQGQAGTITVTVTRGGGYAGAVSLAASGLPAGITASFTPATVPAGTTTSTLTLTAAATAALGQATYSVSASGAGVASATASGGLTVNPAPDFTISLTPTTVTVPQGQSGQTTVTIARTGGFTGAVNLLVTGVPAGVTATYDNNAPVGATATLTVSVGAAVAADTYTLTVTGQGTPGARTAPLTLTVTAAGPVPAFTMAFNPASLSLTQGGIGQAGVIISRSGGFVGPVNLAVTSKPAGVTTNFDTNVPTGNAVLSIEVTPIVVPGSYSIEVQGTAAGLATPTRTITLPLTVTAAPGGFTLTLNPTSIAVTAGQTGQTTITVDKTGSFTGAVSLSALNLPVGVTASFNPASPSASRPGGPLEADVQATSTLSLSVQAGVPANNYALQVRGTAQGLPDQMVNLTLTVTPPVGGGATTWTFCDSDNLPVWFAFQNGTGAWTQVAAIPASGGLSFSFNINVPTGAVAFVTGSPAAGYGGAVYYGTQAELQAFGANRCVTNPNATRALNGSVSGIAALDQATVALGGGFATVQGTNLNYQLSNVLDGPADLLATHTEVTFSGGLAYTPRKVIIRRNQNIPTGGTIPVLNFGTEGFVPASAGLVINNLQVDQTVTTMSYLASGTTGNLFVTPTPSGSALQTIYGIPGAQQAAGDLHLLTVFALRGSDGDGRGITQFFSAFGAKSVTLGPDFGPPAVTSLGSSPYVRYQASGTIQAEYDDIVSFTIAQAGATQGSARSWNVLGTRGYFPGATYTLAIPDLSGAAGWNNLWAIQSGLLTSWAVTGTAYSSGGTLPPNADGTTIFYGIRNGTVNP